MFWGSALANIHPGPDDTHADYKNPNRAPPFPHLRQRGSPHACRIQRSKSKHYKAEGTITEVVEYEGRAHLMPAQTGWEETSPTTPSTGRSSTQRHQPRCQTTQ